METRAKRHWGIFWSGIAILVLGCVFVFLPDISLVTMAIWFGVILLVGGVAQLVQFGMLRRRGGGSGWAIASAVLDFVLGAIFLFHPILAADVLPWLAGWTLVFYGFLGLVAAWGLRSTEFPAGAAAVNAVIAILCGIMFFWLPLSFVYVLGFFLVFRGGTMIAFGATKQLPPEDGMFV